MPIYILEAEVILRVLYRKGGKPKKVGTLGSRDLRSFPNLRCVCSFPHSLRSFLACHARVKLSRQPQGMFRCNFLGMFMHLLGYLLVFSECFVVSDFCGQFMHLSCNIPCSRQFKEFSGIFCNGESSDICPFWAIVRFVM